MKNVSRNEITDEMGIDLSIRVLIFCIGVAIAVGLMYEPAQAGNFFLRNCLDHAKVVCTYNGNDSRMAVHKHSYGLSKGEGKFMSCKGKGKGRCWVSIPTSGSSCSTGQQVRGKLYFNRDYEIIRSGGSANTREQGGPGSTCDD